MPPAARIQRDHDRPAPPALLAEAGAAIIAASLALRLMPFRNLAERMSRGEKGAAMADAFRAAFSKGNYFNRHIRNRYACRELVD